MTEKKSTILMPHDGVSLAGLQGLSPEQPIGVSNQKEVDWNAGIRFDNGKNRLDLIPPEWEWELGRVLTFGASKYADRNWERGMDWSRIAGSAKRHFNKFLRGEQIDEESQCHHLALMAWNALALMSYDLRGLGTDNLNRGQWEPKE